VILTLAVRSLSTRPLRSAVLAAGFGLGIAVMAALLGVGDVILHQARSPALAGGGDLVVTGSAGRVDSARFLLTEVIGSDRLGPRTVAASPSRKASLYLVGKGGAPIPISVRGAIPSLQKAVGDPEVSNQSNWTDGPADASWTRPQPGDILRAMDRFHPMPRAGAQTSWAEWLYFNGRTSDGRIRFYLTFLVGEGDGSGTAPAIVRLQLDRSGRSTNYSAVSRVDERTILERAPDLDIAGNRVRLEGSRYAMRLALREESASGRSAIGEIALDTSPGRSLPPMTIHGARGWVSGYVVPVLSGTFRGTLTIDGEPLSLDGAAGYHDHNWGFWNDVHWQWGQVADRDLSIVWGRVFPPSSVADPDRVPGLLAVLGPDGPIAFSTNVVIGEGGEGDTPSEITVRATGTAVDLTLTFSVAERVRTRLSMTPIATRSAPLDFLQLGGTYRVAGQAGGRAIAFTARGAAETFRPGS
jgi:hypothetical protein